MSLKTFFTPGRPVGKDQKAWRWFVYVFVLLGLLLDNLNVSGALNTGKSLEEEFNVSSSTASWALSAYALTLGSFIILFGKMGDIIGVHLMYLGGLFIMMVFSVLVASVKSSIIAVIIFRAFQGIGGAALIPSSYAITGNYFKGKDFYTALTVFSIFLVCSFGIGLILGGALGFSHFFYFSFAVAAVCFIVLWFIIIPVERTAAHDKLKLKNLDFPVGAMLVVGLLLIIFGLTEAANTWNSPKVYVTIPIGFCLLVAIFLFENVYLRTYQKNHQANYHQSDDHDEKGSKESPIEQHTYDSDDPINNKKSWRMNVDLLFPIEIFQLKNCLPLFFSLFLYYASFIVYMTSLLQYYEYLHGDSALLAGVKLLPLTIGLVVSSITVTPGYVSFIGYKRSLILSGTLSLGAAIWINRSDYTVVNDYWKFNAVPLFLSGFGVNSFFKVYLSSIMLQTEPHLHGLVTGIFQTGAQIGVSIANSIASTMIGNIAVQLAKEDYKPLLFHKFRNVLYLNLAINSTVFLLMFTIKEAKPEEVEQEQPATDNQV
ncbi:hypothetical protein DASC09_009590 [Saccharomycopsis crataegensis]|uniref:Major facilitator superfamily (MFS) profile domain-containing protein n=1 Tax=Saccharomycopsis crataegensis TaxID=43959 RepID=A0AAV5QG45_9ASCO|nr:hypothetical protein DASC09_009590 [Saccharomycopsis crataegensis]